MVESIASNVAVVKVCTWFKRWLLKSELRNMIYFCFTVKWCNWPLSIDCFGADTTTDRCLVIFEPLLRLWRKIDPFVTRDSFFYSDSQRNYIHFMSGQVFLLDSVLLWLLHISAVCRASFPCYKSLIVIHYSPHTTHTQSDTAASAINDQQST